MPELPEVETIRRGLAPLLTGTRILKVDLRRPDLRFPFPCNFVQRLEGQTILSVSRRAKYLLLALSGGDTLLCHLGMTGNFRLADPAPASPGVHDHVIMHLDDQGSVAAARSASVPALIYRDPRRFGFMEIFRDERTCPRLSGLGPEPLGNGFSVALLVERFACRRGPVKTALLDQKLVAGLGNIYVCEALFRAAIHPATPANQLVAKNRSGVFVPDPRLDRLVNAIRQVLEEALAAGGSTLNDFRNVAGDGGYFQHRFAVYGREGESCPDAGCGGVVERIVQSARSSFFCPRCQPL